MSQAQPSQNQRLYSLEQASAALGGTSVWTLRRHVTLKNIQTTRVGKRVFINSEELDRLGREGLPSLGGGK